jgi:hypothetical protein
LFDAIAMQLQTISEYLLVHARGLPIIAAQFASKTAYTIAGNMMTGGILRCADCDHFFLSSCSFDTLLVEKQT